MDKGGCWVWPGVRLKSVLITGLHVQFAEKFQEVKEAARRDKSQEKIETASDHSQVSNLSLK